MKKVKDEQFIEKAKQEKVSIKFSLNDGDKITNYEQFWDVFCYIVEKIFQSKKGKTKNGSVLITSDELNTKLDLPFLSISELFKLVKLVCRIQIKITSDTAKYYSHINAIYEVKGTRKNGVETIEEFKFYTPVIQLKGYDPHFSNQF